MIDRGSITDRHKYQAIAWDIRDRIIRGELRPGDAIPSLPAIREQWGVSYQSGQAAVALLKSWGLVETKQGRGTYVLTVRPVLNLMTEMTLPDADGNRRTWKSIVADYGMVGSQRVIGAGRTAIPPDVADAYGYEADFQIGWRERLMLVDEQPVQIATSYYPDFIVELAQELVLPERLPINAMELIARAGHDIAGGRDIGFARAATSEESGKLAIDAGTPVTEVFRVARNTDGEIVTVERMVSYSARLRQAWNF